MPLDAQDKLRLEEIERLLASVTTDPRVRDQLVSAGSQMARIMLEIVPPDSILRERIIERFTDAILLLAATSGKPFEAAKT